MATNYMTYDDAADVLQAYANKIKEGGGSVTTWAQYQALPSEQQNSGLYYITDKNGCDITANDLAITDANNILGGGAGAATDTQTLMNGATTKINQLNQSLTGEDYTPDPIQTVPMQAHRRGNIVIITGSYTRTNGAITKNTAVTIGTLPASMRPKNNVYSSMATTDHQGNDTGPSYISIDKGNGAVILRTANDFNTNTFIFFFFTFALG